MRNDRKTMLEEKGIDTSKFFTVVTNEDLPKGSKIYIEMPQTETAQKIIENGYVKNTKLHRRFVMAHYMRMMNARGNWYEVLDRYYTYMYQLDMMINEVRILSILSRKDNSVFRERARFFTPSTVDAVMLEYYKDVRAYVAALPVYKCKGKEYKKLPKIGNVFTSELEQRVFQPLYNAIQDVESACSYEQKYHALMNAKRKFVELPWNTKKIKVWRNAFQANGAYYTLKNMVMYHDCALPVRECERAICGMQKYQTSVKGEKAAEALKMILTRCDYQGYQWHALLEETIRVNNFNFIESINNK